jgi:hypothetical protein
MLLSNVQLNAVWRKISGRDLEPHQMNQAKALIDGVFDTLPVRGHIDETNAVAFDAYELSGCQVEPTYTRPNWE